MITTTTDSDAGPVLAESCDRCSARAGVLTTFQFGDVVSDLRWCGHHFIAYEHTIRETAGFLEATTIGLGNTRV